MNSGDGENLVDEVFRITRTKMSESDPVVVAALFFSHKIREAGDIAAAKINEAAESASSAVLAAQHAARASELLCVRLDTERTELTKELARARTLMVADFAAERSAWATEQAAKSKAVANAFETRLQKGLREVLRSQSSGEGPPQGWRGVLAGVAVGMFTMAGIVSIACQGSFSWIDDARVGKIFSQIYPKLSPAAKAEVMKHGADALR